MKRQGLAALPVLLLAAAPALAAFEDLGYGARAPGMAGAFTALADDAYALFYNPAGLAQLERPHVGLSYTRLYGGLSDASELSSSQLAYAQPMLYGRKGALGVGWNRFALSGLYQEQTLSLGYGRRVLQRPDGSQLMAGLAGSFLSRSFTRGSEASSACQNGVCGLGADPVLSGSNSRSAVDADLGLLYRFPRRLQAGLAVRHFMTPNVAFSGTDRLERSYRAGLSYKSLWMSLSSELRLQKAVAGGNDRDLLFGAERVFPTLDMGQFALRGGLGVGGGDYREATLGLAYRINKIQIDYAFLLPVGAVSGDVGTHRLGIGFHFGALDPDDELARELLEKARRPPEKVPAPVVEEPKREPAFQDIDDPRLAGVRALIAERGYLAAHKALLDGAREAALSPALSKLAERLNLVLSIYHQLPPARGKPEQTLVNAIERFLRSGDRLAVLQMSYALSLKDGDPQVDALLAKLENSVGATALRLPDGHPRGFIDELIERAKAAAERGEHMLVEGLLLDVLALEPDNALAAERLRLHHLGQGEPPARPAPAPALPPAPAAPARVAAPLSLNPRELEKLYQRGVEHYARGEYPEASAMFSHILKLDPGNAAARKALERIKTLRDMGGVK